MYETVIGIAIESWNVMEEMAPYIIFGFGFAGLLSVFISQKTVERHLGGNKLLPIIKSALFGIPLPLCSCGVIPVAASLRRNGASRGATTSFLISTPQTGVDSIMVTLGLLGPVFAVFRPVAAFINGLIGGILVKIFGNDDDIKTNENITCANGCGVDEKPKGNKLFQAFHYGFISLPQDISKALLIGLIVAGGISALIPPEFLLPFLGTGIGAMIVMMLLGIPVYVCATASVPIAAALIAKGVSPGAALVFLMTGPATNAAAIATVWKILGRRTAIIYLASVALTALWSGILLDFVFNYSGTTATSSMPWMLPGIVKTLSAFALLAILGYAIISPHMKKDSHLLKEAGMDETMTLKIKGMTCNHCVANVTRVLKEGKGVEWVDVDLKKGHAVISGKDFDLAALGKAVTELGYKIEENRE